MNALFFDSHSDPFNFTIAEWTSLWWKWLNSIPRDQSPAMDISGRFCGMSQHHQSVWFLAGTFGGSATRNCNIPNGKAILFPIIASIFSFATDPHLKTEEDLLSTVTRDINKVERLCLTIDGIVFDDLRNFRVRSEVFCDIINGTLTKVVSDGYWVFLRPLQIGNHKIHFLGKNIDFFNEVTYSISIT
jgi:hypothetical protein